MGMLLTRDSLGSLGIFGDSFGRFETDLIRLFQASRKVAKCGYLFAAPDWDFSNPINRTKVSTSTI